MDAAVYQPFASLALALVVGVLIGLERERSAPGTEEHNVRSFMGGARTHPLVALSGALSAMLSQGGGGMVLLLSMGGMLAFLVVSYADDVKRGVDRGLTSEVAVLVTFLLGALCTMPNVVEPLERRALLVASAAVVTTVLLALKPVLHGFIQKATEQDVYATVKFLLVAVVVLPLLPNQTYDPWQVLNPYQIGLMVVLIAGIGFVGYVGTRVLGPGRGMGLTGLVGGLVSSTAVTFSAAARARQDPGAVGGAALACILASTVMTVRVMVEVAVVNLELLKTVAVPLCAMTVGGLGAAAWFYRESTKETTQANMVFANPFELGSALKFGGLFALILVVTKAATENLGEAGIYAAGALAGVTDVDAITLTMAKLAKDGLDPFVASTTIMLGVGSNTLVKGGVALVMGGRLLGRRVLGAFGVELVLAAVGLLVVRLV